MTDDDKGMQVAVVLLTTSAVCSALTWISSTIDSSRIKNIDKSLQHIEMRLDDQKVQFEVLRRQMEIQSMFDEAVRKWEARNNAETAPAVH